MVNLFATTQTSNEKNGNGKYRPLRKRKRSAKQSNKADFDYFSTQDLTMRFNKTEDPIYFVFDCIEKRSVPQLMGDLVQDSLFSITNFVSKVIKK